MSNHPDDGYYRDDPDRAERDRDRDSGDGARDGQTVALARGAVAAPAMFLILNGLLGLLFVAIASVPMVFQPEMLIKFGRDVAAQQPPGPQRQDLERQMDEAENELNQNRAAAQIQNALELALLAVGNLLAILGGFSMRSLGSYGLSMAGAVVSLIPILTGCCCTGTLFGIWSLVVLLRPEVKAGFAARRRTAYSPDAY